MANLKDVADRANVAPSTVSRVLRHDPTFRVGDDTRQRILKVAKELAYRPNAVARSLRTSKTDTIGLIMPDLDNIGFLEVFKGIDERCSQLGYQVIVASADADPEREQRFASFMASGRVEGYVIASAQKYDEAVANILDTGAPVVLANRRTLGKDARLGWVIVDDVAGGAQACSFLAEKGHHRLGILRGRFNTDTWTRREQGFRERADELGLEILEHAVVPGDYSLSSGQAGAVAIASLPAGDRPTALLVGNLMMGLGALIGFRELGLNVPSDISIVAFDDHPLAAVTNPPITTVALPLREMGRRAVDALKAMIEDPATAPKVMVEGQIRIVERESVERIESAS